MLPGVLGHKLVEFKLLLVRLDVSSRMIVGCAGKASEFYRISLLLNSRQVVNFPHVKVQVGSGWEDSVTYLTRGFAFMNTQMVLKGLFCWKMTWNRYHRKIEVCFARENSRCFLKFVKFRQSLDACEPYGLSSLKLLKGAYCKLDKESCPCGHPNGFEGSFCLKMTWDKYHRKIVCFSRENSRCFLKVASNEDSEKPGCFWATWAFRFETVERCFLQMEQKVFPLCLLTWL